MTHSENCSTVQDTIRHAWIFAIDEERDWREKKKSRNGHFLFNVREMVTFIIYETPYIIFVFYFDLPTCEVNCI